MRDLKPSSNLQIGGDSFALAGVALDAQIGVETAM